MTQKMLRSCGLAAAAALTLTLAACSGGQSTADACKIADEKMTDVSNQAMTDVQDSMQQLMNGENVDFDAIFSPISESLDETQGEITNEEVSDAVSNFATAFNGLADELSGFEMPDMSQIDASDPEAMAELQQVQEEATALQQTLTEKTQELQDAQQQVADVCNAG